MYHVVIIVQLVVYSLKSNYHVQYRSLVPYTPLFKQASLARSP